MPTLVEKIRKRLDRKFLRMAKEDRLHWLPDKLFLSWMFRIKMGYKLNWKNPRTLNEKLQWLKFYNKNPQYTEMVDKYGVREYVKRTIGEEYLIPLLGVWDKFDDIDFDKLPKEFVLKCTHDSGGLVICRKNSTRLQPGKRLGRASRGIIITVGVNGPIGISARALLRNNLWKMTFWGDFRITSFSALTDALIVSWSA